MSKKYITLNNGDSFEIERGGVINMGCCDCGLVHNILVAIKGNNNVRLTIFRDNRRTGQKRRFNKFDKK